MEKILDWLVTIIFVIAMIAIAFFIYKGAKDHIFGLNENDMEIGIFDDEYNDVDVDNRYDNEDEDYYEDDGEDLYEEEEERAAQLPEEYDDAIANIMNEVVEETNGNPKEAELEEKKEEPKLEKKIIETDFEPEIEERKAEPSKIEPPKSKKEDPPSITAHNAKYLVLAGAFGTKVNAEAQAKILRDLGYKPEIVNFINPEVNTVVAARYNSKASAEAAEKQLKSKKIECYVFTKK